MELKVSGGKGSGRAPVAACFAHLLTWTGFSLARTPFSSSFSSFVTSPGVSAGISGRAGPGLVQETKRPKRRRGSQLNPPLSRTVLSSRQGGRPLCRHLRSAASEIFKATNFNQLAEQRVRIWTIIFSPSEEYKPSKIWGQT